jgi:hypothetical protein
MFICFGMLLKTFFLLWVSKQRRFDCQTDVDCPHASRSTTIEIDLSNCVTLHAGLKNDNQ